jgi:hypothetical protein
MQHHEGVAANCNKISFLRVRTCSSQPKSADTPDSRSTSRSLSQTCAYTACSLSLSASELRVVVLLVLLLSTALAVVHVLAVCLEVPVGRLLLDKHEQKGQETRLYHHL